MIALAHGGAHDHGQRRACRSPRPRSLTTRLLSSAATSTSGASQKPATANELNIVVDPTGPFTNGFNPFSSSNSAYVQGAAPQA